MSLALFRSTLRSAIQDAWAEDTLPANGQAPGTEACAMSAKARAVVRDPRLQFILHEGRGAVGRAS